MEEYQRCGYTALNYDASIVQELIQYSIQQWIVMDAQFRWFRNQRQARSDVVQNQGGADLGVRLP